jgi:hypothetical protein
MIAVPARWYGCNLSGRREAGGQSQDILKPVGKRLRTIGANVNHPVSVPRAPSRFSCDLRR